jgi:hypothetical protein
MTKYPEVAEIELHRRIMRETENFVEVRSLANLGHRSITPDMKAGAENAISEHR